MKRARVPDVQRSGGLPVPSRDLYAAIFALDSVGRGIELSDSLLLHFPAVFCAMEEPEPAFRRRAKAIFSEFTSRFEGVPHSLVTRGFATMSRHLLESYA
mmetsp:Transcript_2167/g.6464  ORF Transcript_2167/g.6464 Transcript_2167/m.6464 type:complete len:100 (+) Transcript_2167:357-656(+)